MNKAEFQSTELEMRDRLRLLEQARDQLLGDSASSEHQEIVKDLARIRTQTLTELRDDFERLKKDLADALEERS